MRIIRVGIDYADDFPPLNRIYLSHAIDDTEFENITNTDILADNIGNIVSIKLKEWFNKELNEKRL